MDKTTPEISVIVVCYNQESSIARTLDSILEQKDCGAIEIVVNDDHSSDRTAEIVKEYESRNPGTISLHVQPSNLGVQGNYFHALARCRGKYVADCAGDDRWCDALKLSKEKSVLDSNPDVTLVHTDWNYSYPDGKKKRYDRHRFKLEGVYESEPMTEHILCGDDHPAVHLCTALYRKDAALKALDENRELFLNPEYGCEDLQLAAALAHIGKTAFIPDVTLDYSVGIVSISSSESFSKTFDFYYGANALRLQLMKKYGIEPAKIARTMSKLTDFLLAQAFYAGSKIQFRKGMKFANENRIGISMKSRLYSLLINIPYSRKVVGNCRKFISKIFA